MPIRFNQLGKHLQHDIVQKTECIAYANFSRTCKHAEYLAESVWNQITRDVQILYFLSADEEEIEILNGPKCDINGLYDLARPMSCSIFRLKIGEMELCHGLDDRTCRNLIRFLNFTSSTIRLLAVHRPVTCSSKNFNKLMELAKVAEMDTSYIFNGKFLCLPFAEKLRILEGWCSINDAQFLQLKVPDIKISNNSITSQGFNQFLKEWIDGTRKFNSVFMHTRYPLNIETIVGGLPFEEVFNEHSMELNWQYKRGQDILVVQIRKNKISMRVDQEGQPVDTTVHFSEFDA